MRSQMIDIDIDAFLESPRWARGVVQ